MKARPRALMSPLSGFASLVAIAMAGAMASRVYGRPEPVPVKRGKRAARVGLSPYPKRLSDRSKYSPHQGERERAKRRRKALRLMARRVVAQTPSMLIDMRPLAERTGLGSMTTMEENRCKLKF